MADFEDTVRIRTPEGVDLDLPLANIGSRFLGALLDELLRLCILFGLITVAAPILGAVGAEGVVVALVIIGLFVLTFFYDVFFEVRVNGRTPGKRAAGIRVVRIGGEPIGFMTSCIRNFSRLVDLMPGFYGVGMLSVLLTKHHQRLGDLAAGTIVVRDKKTIAMTGPQFVRAGQVLAPPPGFAYAPEFTPEGKRIFRPGPPAPTGYAYAPVQWQPGWGRRAQPTLAPDPGWDVAAVSANDIAVVRMFLTRRNSIDDAARKRLADELAQRLARRVAGVPSGTSPEQMLEGIAAAKAAREDD